MDEKVNPFDELIKLQNERPKYDTWLVDSITVDISHGWVHVRCPKEYYLLETSDCFYYGPISRIIHGNITNFSFTCVKKFRKRLIKENELAVKSYFINQSNMISSY